MKIRLTIDIETDKDHKNLNIEYKRKDIVVPETKEDKLMASYIEHLVRYTIDNGFQKPTVETIPDTKGEYDGETVSK